ncbi:MAG: DegQ family serine endoprotease [Gemmobacter sp.]
MTSSRAVTLSRPAQTMPYRQMVLTLALGLLLVLAQVMAAGARMPDTFADLAERISPSVVNITTSTTVAARSGPSPLVPEGSPFEDFFRDFMDRGERGDPAPRRGQALGSGFVISEDGFIVTNNHVIEGADEIEVEFFSGERLKAEVVGTDPDTDIALLKVESEDPLPFVVFGDSDVMRVGDWVVAMGNPLGQGFSVSAGIVSARGRTLAGSYDNYLQTDAAINRGNSGGPLFNMTGEVIGVNTAILSPTGGSIGIGFAMASNVVTRVVDQLRDFGETRRGWLGVRIQDVTPDVAEAMSLPRAAGALVTDVPDGPAKDAGLLSGDVILSFDGSDVADTRDLVRRVGDAEVGRSVPLVVLREGDEQVIDVVLGRRETADSDARRPAGADPQEPATRELLGMTITTLSPDQRDQMGLPSGTEGLLVTEVDEVSEAWSKGMRAGDVITEAGQQKVTQPSDLSDRIEEARDAGRRSILLLIRRGGDPLFVALSVEE